MLKKSLNKLSLSYQGSSAQYVNYSMIYKIKQYSLQNWPMKVLLNQLLCLQAWMALMLVSWLVLPLFLRHLCWLFLQMLVCLLHS